MGKGQGSLDKNVWIVAFVGCDRSDVVHTRVEDGKILDLGNRSYCSIMYIAK